MPTNNYIQARLIREIASKPGERITRYALVHVFGNSYREQADSQISFLVSNNTFKTTGKGSRGHPEIVSPGPMFPKSECPMCSQAVFTMMRSLDHVRLNLILIVKSKPEGWTRKELVRKFNWSDRQRTDDQIGLLLSDGVFISTGLGRRGNPERILAGPGFPKHRCPMCLQARLGNYIDNSRK